MVRIGGKLPESDWNLFRICAERTGPRFSSDTSGEKRLIHCGGVRDMRGLACFEVHLRRVSVQRRGRCSQCPCKRSMSSWRENFCNMERKSSRTGSCTGGLSEKFFLADGSDKLLEIERFEVCDVLEVSCAEGGKGRGEHG